MTDENMAHANCMLNIQGYRHTFRIRKIYCFYSATIFCMNASHCYTYIGCVFMDTGTWPLPSPCVVHCGGSNTATGRSPLRSTAIAYLMLFVGFSINSVLVLVLFLICLGKHVSVTSDVVQFICSACWVGRHTLY
jgi:hypothetical protein